MKSFEQIHKRFSNDEATKEREANDDGVGDTANFGRQNFREPFFNKTFLDETILWHQNIIKTNFDEGLRN